MPYKILVWKNRRLWIYTKMISLTVFKISGSLEMDNIEKTSLLGLHSLVHAESWAPELGLILRMVN